MGSWFDVANDCLAAVVDIDTFNTDDLFSTSAQPPQRFDLHSLGPEQAAGG
jgi:hypothetical protein